MQVILASSVISLPHLGMVNKRQSQGRNLLPGEVNHTISCHPACSFLVFPTPTTHLASIRLPSCSNRCGLSRLLWPTSILTSCHPCKGETNQQLSHFLFLWPSSWHPLSYSNGVKAFSKQCCPLDTKKVSGHMLNRLLLGILPHREPVKSLWAHLYSCCLLGETHQDFILEQDLLWEAEIGNTSHTALNLTLMCINKQVLIVTQVSDTIVERHHAGLVLG